MLHVHECLVIASVFHWLKEQIVRPVVALAIVEIPDSVGSFQSVFELWRSYP